MWQDLVVVWQLPEEDSESWHQVDPLEIRFAACQQWLGSCWTQKS